MAEILDVKDLSKRYDGNGFALQHVSFSIPAGSIVGFIGENGAGKSTTMGSIIGTLQKDDGDIHIFGDPMDLKDSTIKEDIGVVFDDMNLPYDLTINQLGKVFKKLYTRWETDTFAYYIDLFSLPRDKKVGTFSRGMSMKISVAIALSHQARLLILDEATAGLDPSGREELLEVLQEFVKDGQRGILLSSHITSDIEKIADSLIFIKNGQLILKVEKEDLLQNYAIFHCTDEECEQIENDMLITYRRQIEGMEVLVSNKEKVPNHVEEQPFTIDDIALLLMRGEKG